MLKFSFDNGEKTIGWAVIKDGNIIDSGVRVFNAVVEAKGGKPLNQERRNKRMMRRQYNRKNNRKRIIKRFLINSGLLAESCFTDNNYFLNLGNPYELRANALDRQMSKEEIGSIIFHILNNRGFRSSMKSLSKEDKKELEAATELANNIENSGYRTAGEFFYNSVYINKTLDCTKGLKIYRSLVEKEIDLILKKQQEFYPEIITEGFIDQINHNLEFQRPLKLQKNLVGKCDLEPKRKRANKLTLIGQEYKIKSYLNNMLLIHLDGTKLPLTTSQREKAFELLFSSKETPLKKFKKEIGIDDDVEINLISASEKNDNPKIKGNDVYKIFNASGKKIFDKLNQDEKIEFLITYNTVFHPETLRKKLTDYGFGKKNATEMSEKRSSSGYFNLSKKAMTKVMTLLNDGLNSEVALRECYAIKTSPEKTKLSGSIPVFEDLRNPTVNKTLSQQRKVFNALVEKHGTPDEVVLEVTRELKMGQKKKAQVAKKQKGNETERAKAIQFLESVGHKNPSRDMVEKYLLWVEAKYICPFTGRPIGFEQLGEAEVEHIIPLSVSFDDSFMNKTIVFNSATNKNKGNRTAMDFFMSFDEETREKRLKTIKNNMPHKYKKFLVTTEQYLEDANFTSRQLNDTSYICQKIATHFQKNGIKTRTVKGGLTGSVRKLMGIKKDRDLHYHHAIDAMLIGIFSEAEINLMYKDIQKVFSHDKKGGFSALSSILRRRYSSVITGIETHIENMVISHEVNKNKIKGFGSLHDDTLCGIYEDNGSENIILSKRVAIKDLKIPMLLDNKIIGEQVHECICKAIINRFNLTSASEISKINDKDFKSFIESGDITYSNGNKIKGFSIKENAKRETLVPKKNKDGKIIGYFRAGDNHHLELVDNDLSHKPQTISNYNFSKDKKLGKKNIFINDTVELDGILYRVRQVAKNKVMIESIALSNPPKNSPTKSGKKLLNINKIHVTVLGEIKKLTYRDETYNRDK